MSEKRMSLPIFPVDNLCGSCSAACCRRGITMALTEQESEVLKENGALLYLTDLTQERSDRAESKSYYYLEEDCPFLVQTVGAAAICSVYDDERKPSVCNDFEAGGEVCLRMRETTSAPPDRPPTQQDFMM